MRPCLVATSECDCGVEALSNIAYRSVMQDEKDGEGVSDPAVCVA